MSLFRKIAVSLALADTWDKMGDLFKILSSKLYFLLTMRSIAKTTLSAIFLFSGSVPAAWLSWAASWDKENFSPFFKSKLFLKYLLHSWFPRQLIELGREVGGEGGHLLLHLHSGWKWMKYKTEFPLSHCCAVEGARMIFFCLKITLEHWLSQFDSQHLYEQLTCCKISTILNHNSWLFR